MEPEKDRDPQDLGQGEGEGEGSGLADRVRGDEGRGVEEVTSQASTETSQEPAPPAASMNAAEGQPQGITLSARNPLHIKITAYDGPLDLLLDLIKKNEMDIYNIQITEITRQYLQYLEEMRQLNLEVAGEFLVLAATLLYIKSRTLLPVEDEIDDEDGLDPREELVRKLLEYQAFKEAAKSLGLLESERSQIFTRQLSEYYLADLDMEEPQIDTFSANLYDLLSAFQKVLTRQGKENLHEVFEQVVSIEEKMAEIKIVLMSEKRVLFTKLFGESVTRNELIATFLALLEIVRSKYAVVSQDQQFGEIVIEKTDNTLIPVEEEAK